MNASWLQQYLAAAVEKKLCTSIYCTTCGARQFRNGLRETLAEVTNGQSEALLGRAGFETLVEALATVVPDPLQHAAFEEAVRCLIFDLWCGFPFFQEELAQRLSGTWAGSVLQGMQHHHAESVRLRRGREEYDDPANVQKRRDEKKRLRQEQHRLRLEAKKERDRIWREQHGGSE